MRGRGWENERGLKFVRKQSGGIDMMVYSSIKRLEESQRYIVMQEGKSGGNRPPSSERPAVNAEAWEPGTGERERKGGDSPRK